MGIEISQYISGLTATWPPSGDPKSQGDDHLRLIKGVLQGTFPNGSKAYYFPKGEAISAGPMVLDATDQNNVITVTTTGADVAVTLPAGFVAADAGWSCEIMKVSSDVNGVVVSPASGTISSKSGSTATIRVGAFCEPARFLWTGAVWVCVKPGPMVGSTFNWDGATVPYGCMVLDGTTFSGTTFAELAAVLGTTTLKDKRGRAEIGAGTGVGLSARVNGTAYGGETAQLSLTHLPAQTPSGTIALPGISGGGAITNASSFVCPVGAGVNVPNMTLASITFTGSATFFGTAMPGQNQTPFGILQPSIGTQKLIRAC